MVITYKTPVMVQARPNLIIKRGCEPENPPLTKELWAVHSCCDNFLFFFFWAIIYLFFLFIENRIFSHIYHDYTLIRNAIKALYWNQNIHTEDLVKIYLDPVYAAPVSMSSYDLCSHWFRGSCFIGGFYPLWLLTFSTFSSTWFLISEMRDLMEIFPLRLSVTRL